MRYSRGLTFTGRVKQLTVYVTETDQADHQPLYTAIVQLLRREGCVGATVTRGVAGFGSSAVIHASQILVLSMDMPMIISVVDRPGAHRSYSGAAKGAGAQCLYNGPGS